MLKFICLKNKLLLVVFLIVCQHAVAHPINNLNYFNGKLYGRTAEYSQLKKNLSNCKTLQTMFISGIPGIGKKYLLKHYLKEHFNDYGIIWWFSGKTELNKQINSLKAQLPIKDSIKNYLSSTTKNWILVFDKLPDMQEAKKIIPFLTITNKAHVIFISEKKTGFKNAINLTELLPHKAVFMLKDLTNGRLPDSSYMKIANFYNNIPIFLANAAKIINTDKKIDYEYIDNAIHKEKLPINHIRSIINLITTLMENDQIIYHILEFISVTNSNLIPEKMLELWHNHYFYKVKKTAYQEAIDKLLRYQLLQIEKHDLHSQNTIYRISSIFKKIITKELDLKNNKLKELKSEYINSLFLLINHSGYTPIDPVANIIEEHANEILAASNNVLKKTEVNLIFSILIALMDVNQITKRDFTKAHKIAEKLKILIDKNNNINSKLILRLYNNISGLYWWQGNHNAGIKLHLKHSKYYKAFKKHHAPEYGKFMLYLLSHYNFTGNIPEGKAIINYFNNNEKQLKIQKHPNDTTFPTFNSALFWQNLTTFNILKSDYDAAYNSINTAFESLEPIIIANHNNNNRHKIYLHFYLTKFEVLSKLNVLGKHENLISETLKLQQNPSNSINNRVYGNTLIYLAQAQLSNNKAIAAANNASLGIKYLKNWFKNKPHFDIAKAEMVLGDIYFHTNDFIKSAEQYQKSYKLFENSFTYLQNDYISSILFKIINSFIKQGDHYTAMKYRQKYLNIFGKKHFKKQYIDKLMVEYEKSTNT